MNQITHIKLTIFNWIGTKLKWQHIKKTHTNYAVCDRSWFFILGGIQFLNYWVYIINIKKSSIIQTKSIQYILNLPNNWVVRVDESMNQKYIDQFVCYFWMFFECIEFNWWIETENQKRIKEGFGLLTMEERRLKGNALKW